MKSHNLAVLFGMLGGVAIFRGSIAIKSVGDFITNNPYIVIGIGVVFVIFGAKLAKMIIKD